jgi:hypothetical protein
LFCALWPKRPAVPSLPLWLTWPEIELNASTTLVLPRMPRFCLAAVSDAWLRRISLSGIASISPAPNTGVGMRKITLRFATAAPKSGCAMLQPGASVRPTTVNSACTPPSGVPSALRTKRASRTGPSARMNDGNLLVAPFLLANATCGFTGGLVPPTLGCAWQPPQLSRFIVGPRPSSGSSASLKSVLPAMNAAVCGGVKLGSGAPASLAPARGPGSLAVDGGGVKLLVSASAVSRVSSGAAPALAMSVLAACVTGAVLSSEPPLHASKPALAVIKTIGNLMSSSFERNG